MAGICFGRASLIDDSVQYRPCFGICKNDILGRVNDMGDLEFIIDTLESDEVRKLYEKERYDESLYLLSLLDRLCIANGLPICADYEAIRKDKARNVI